MATKKSVHIYVLPEEWRAVEKEAKRLGITCTMVVRDRIRTLMTERLIGEKE
jgi:hypothetical protein